MTAQRWPGRCFFVEPSRCLGYYELYHGAVNEGRDPVLVEDNLPWVERVEYNRSHALEGARIRQELAEKGQRIQHPDMMVAGVARALDVPQWARRERLN